MCFTLNRQFERIILNPLKVNEEILKKAEKREWFLLKNGQLISKLVTKKKFN